MITQLVSFAIAATVIGSLLYSAIYVADRIDARQQAARYEEHRRNIRYRLEMERAAEQREE